MPYVIPKSRMLGFRELMTVNQVVKRSILLGLLALAGLGQVSQAGFRCGSSLVNEGDWPTEIEQRCGPPDYISTYPTATVAGLGVVQTEEHWYYNPGPQRFVKRLVFRNGKFVRSESLGYGFHVSGGRGCDPGTLRHISNEYELITRCGEPASKRVEWQIPSGHNRSENWQALNPVLIQEWLYEFSDNQFRQIVTLKNGKVVNVESRSGK